jgi:hypothetical protein
MCWVLQGADSCNRTVLEILNALLINIRVNNINRFPKCLRTSLKMWLHVVPEPCLSEFRPPLPVSHRFTLILLPSWRKYRRGSLSDGQSNPWQWLRGSRCHFQHSPLQVKAGSKLEDAWTRRWPLTSKQLLVCLCSIPYGHNEKMEAKLNLS